MMSRATSQDNERLGEPTLGQVMRRPQWILALLLAIAVAGGFAWLGQWQLGHAIQENANDAELSESPRPLDELTSPWSPIGDEAAGMTVTTSGTLIAADTVVIDGRKNHGEIGAWVVGHLAMPGETGSTVESHIALALGWAANRADAEDAAARLAPLIDGAQVSITGRYMPPDGALIPGAGEDPTLLHRLVPGQLVNLWQPFDGKAYAGYLVLHADGETPASGADVGADVGAAAADVLSPQALAEAGLEVIESVPPLPVETVNWLNLFYAAEWVVFAGFAVFLWYRLTRDAWEKEHEMKELLASRAASGDGPDPDAEIDSAAER